MVRVVYGNTAIDEAYADLGSAKVALEKLWECVRYQPVLLDGSDGWHVLAVYCYSRLIALLVEV